MEQIKNYLKAMDTQTIIDACNEVVGMDHMEAFIRPMSEAGFYIGIINDDTDIDNFKSSDAYIVYNPWRKTLISFNSAADEQLDTLIDDMAWYLVYDDENLEELRNDKELVSLINERKERGIKK